MHTVTVGSPAVADVSRARLDSAAPTDQRPTILIVDDEASIQLMFSAALGLQGLLPLCAASVRDALATLKQRTIDAIILDIRMPGASGLRLLEAIRFDSRWRHLPVLIVTGSDLSEDEQDVVRKLGAYVFYKPESHFDILSQLQRVLPTTARASTSD